MTKKEMIAEEIFLDDQEFAFTRRPYNWLNAPYHTKIHYEEQADKFIRVVKRVKRRMKHERI